MSEPESVVKARRAGCLLDNVICTDKELREVLAGLNYVIPWLEGAGYRKRIIGPLRAERRIFEAMQTEREKP